MPAATEVRLELDDQEAHDLHHALSVVVQVMDYAIASNGIPADAPLQPEARERLIVVARRLDHERRHKGAVPNPNRRTV